MAEVLVDTTVMEKAITYPTDVTDQTAPFFTSA
jgi:hypothetical protein